MITILSVLFTLASSHAMAPIEEVTIANSYNKIPLLGAGLRNKKIAFLKFKVYVASIFAKNETAWSDAKEPIAIRLDFLRDVPNGKIIDSFSSSLKTNKVDLDAPEFKKLLEVVRKNGDIKEKQSLTIAGTRGKTEQLTFTLSTGESVAIEGKAGFVKSFFSIWFGEMDDSGLENLREQVLSKKI